MYVKKKVFSPFMSRHRKINNQHFLICSAFEKEFIMELLVNKFSWSSASGFVEHALANCETEFQLKLSGFKVLMRQSEFLDKTI